MITSMSASRLKMNKCLTTSRAPDARQTIVKSSADITSSRRNSSASILHCDVLHCLRTRTVASVARLNAATNPANDLLGKLSLTELQSAKVWLLAPGEAPLASSKLPRFSGRTEKVCHDA